MPHVVLGLAVAASVYLVSGPLLMLVLAAFRGPADLLPFEPGAVWTLGHVLAVYADPVLYTRIVPDTLVFTGASVLLSFTLAFGLAWLVERTDLPGRDGVYAWLLIPFLVPTLVLGVAWILLLSPNAGWVNLALRAGLGLAGPGPLDVFSMPGLVAVQAMASTPFLFVLLAAALRGMNPALEDASHVAGAGPGTTFVRVTVPVLGPGLLGALLLSTIITLEQFELPLLIGLPARVTVFSARIFWELNPLSGLPGYGRAAAVALPFLATALGLLAVYNRLTGGAGRFVTIGGRGYQPRRHALGGWRWVAFAVVLAYVGLSSGLPLLVLVWSSVYGLAPPSLARLASPSLAAYATLVSDPAVHLAARNTLVVAGLSAAIVTALGALLAWVLVRTRARGRWVLDGVSMISVGIPSVIAGLAVMMLYLSVPVGVYGTLWILVLAYSYRLTVTTRLCRAAMVQIDRELEDASYVAGGSWATTLRRVVMPLLAPALIGAWLLLFIVGVREFTLPMLLHSPDNVVLSVVLWRLFTDGRLAQVSALSTLVLLLILGAALVVRRALLPRLGGF